MSEQEKVKTVRAIKIKEVLGVTAKEAEVSAEYLALSKKVNDGPLLVIVGEVNAHGKKTTTFGPSVFLLGIFRAKNMVTGEVFRSTKCFLPKDAAENISAVFDAQPSETRGPIGFGYTISVQPHAKSGHTLISEPIATVESVGRESALIQKLAAVEMPKQLSGGKVKQI